ncbi:hypothetical protein [Mycolicibacterium pyrenivorans]|uniref:hypothetical protein n=1 Tax=Mycolicibacterium pyrenivorans TaxID=187102 RepID=UPI0021F2C89C|nr:hypothetical protein [Mycolicibacterium pyrenivorans]MCV7153972.1 hypothetical protein [Mycolicibacterium pyrenivorans]
MADQSERDRLDNVAPGDIITLRPSDEPGAAAGQYKVVHKDLNETSTTIVVTLETDDGETLDLELPADTVVNRSLESKWESAQSPTPHRGS